MQSTFEKPPRKNERDYLNAMAVARAAEIRMIANSELPGFCSPNELAAERSRRAYWAEMDQTNLEMHATYDKDAAAEVARRNGELPR
ncbi:MAG: hypothetical protein D9V45_03045 [Chloroflexi bacterium]|nr:MAG: hypothetical protein D9V45_03045 [Chloroflexota bacterium]